LFYQNNKAPYSLLDGVQTSSSAFGDYTQSKLVNATIEIDRRALKDPAFLISNIDTTATNKGYTINVSFRIKADTVVNYPVLANVALVEKNVIVSSPTSQQGTYRNVVRKLLFGPNGTLVSKKNFIKGETLDLASGEVTIDAYISKPDSLLLVAFVQNFYTKEILQSAVVKSPKKSTSTITAVENPKPVLSAEAIQIYPNPASGTFHFGLPGDFPNGCVWKLSDQRGVNVLKGDFADAANGQKTVSISGLTNGLYIVAISLPGQTPVYKKLVVLNSD
jgi:hypothetical protein